MDSTEWIPHTTKSGKILYYINPATGECKWQRQLNKVDNQNACDTDYSKQLDNAAQASTSQPSCEQNDLHTSACVSLSHDKRLAQTDLSSTSKCAHSSKDQSQHYSDSEKQTDTSAEPLNHQERQMTVDILAECKTAHIQCVESGAVNISQPASFHSGKMPDSVRKESVVQQQILQCRPVQ
ncbi:hypothetical protein OS493_020874 [Desmophyllum pertusum]|uniref:WW domain-containing protein n=1 Tax=Desmophyllum pertusum TaxID=174260 RepID=A0A9W9YB98_9CNID|nr:hypothetical protein OS493_020874 [Desmophyllum pertusum]